MCYVPAFLRISAIAAMGEVWDISAGRPDSQKRPVTPKPDFRGSA